MQNDRPEFDSEIKAIADYALSPLRISDMALTTAYYTFIDSLACAYMALEHAACKQLLGPLVPGMTMDNGMSVPGCTEKLDPVQAAFNIGCLVRWLDFNDTWLAAEWGHPSDNLGCILSLCHYSIVHRGKKITLRDVLAYMIKAHEIQGILALENSFNSVGLDHVILVKIASTAVGCSILGLNFEQTCSALSQAWVDGQALRTYRHAPNTGSRKSWAAGDATARAIQLIFLTEKGEYGYPSVLSAKRWGFQDVSFNSKSIIRKQKYGCYVMENILWKISFPAEFHAQTAAECAIELHPQIKNRFHEIKEIIIETQNAGATIIDKQGPLHNPADRDHCIQYICAIGFIHSEIKAVHYDEETARDPLVDFLRSKMQVKEKTEFTKDYFDPNKRSIANSIQITFNDNTQTNKITKHYPVGHRKRRKEGIPLLLQKTQNAMKLTGIDEQIAHKYCDDDSHKNDGILSASILEVLKDLKF